MMLFVVVFLGVLLVLVASISIDTPTESAFELERRKSQGDRAALQLLQRRKHIADLLSLQRIVISLLLVIVVVICVVQWGWLLGLLLGVLIALQYGAIARLQIIHVLTQKKYEIVEHQIILLLERYPIIGSVTRSITTPVRDSTLGSRDELLHLVSQSGIVLSTDERSLIQHALQFDEKEVKEIMIPRSVVDSISRHELLNPLVLDLLHKTGHSRFPVTDGDIDHVVGVLHLRDLLTVDSSKKHTSKAESAMEQKVFYIHEDQTLDHALAAFLRTHHHLFIVVNEYRETTGIITLEDVIEALIGKKIVDEFDMHHDLRLVAARNPRKNNHTGHGQDV